MHDMRWIQGVRRLIGWIVCSGVLLGSAACHGLLDVTNPTLIQDQTIANAAGAMGWRVSALRELSTEMSPVAFDVALFTDERGFDPNVLPTVPGDAPIYFYYDKRDGEVIEQLQSRGYTDPHLAQLDQVVSTTTLAINAMRSNGPASTKREYLAELFAVRGYAILQMAEDICPGFPINDLASDHSVVLSGPYTRDSAVAYALAQLDSAVAYGRDSVNFLSFARVVRGRALLDLGRYADASAAVDSVSTSFIYATDPSVMGNRFAWDNNGCCEPMGEQKGGNGMPFVSADDPRVQTVYAKQRYLIPEDSLYDQLKYPTNDTPIVLASGIEARLIQAEAALHEPDPDKAFAILDTLRSTVGLGALTIPASADDQVDVVYRERAFWLYLTGRRLGDLRRLITNYGRNAETVFPTGAYPATGTYGTATAFPFTVTAQGQFNSKITAGCTVR